MAKRDGDLKRIFVVYDTAKWDEDYEASEYGEACELDVAWKSVIDNNFKTQGSIKVTTSRDYSNHHHYSNGNPQRVFRSNATGPLPNEKRERMIVRPPGTRVSQFLRFIISKKNFERIFQEIIADMREEYYQELSAGRERSARWIHIRCYVNVACAFVLLIGGLVELIRKISRS